jgi:hypothetical protein
MPNRDWFEGASYWELLANLTNDRFVPLCAGIVNSIEGDVVRLCGTWRYVHEGPAFATRERAAEYARKHRPSDADVEEAPPVSSVRRSSPVSSALLQSAHLPASNDEPTPESDAYSRG